MSALTEGFRPDLFSTAPEDLAEYGKDWSGVLPSRPSIIAFPRSTEEVSALLARCHALKVAVVPSGGRTGLSGGASAADGELVLSLVRMNRIGAFDAGALTIEVEAGVVTEAVHHVLAPYGMTWPVDFASKGSSTIGGNIATNAGGVRVIRYGLTRNWVLGLTVVLMSGEILHLNGALEKNNTGIDLRQLFIGSEGVLGVITSAFLKCAPLPDARSTSVALARMQDFSQVIALFRFLRREPVVLSAYETFSEPCLRAAVATGVAEPFGGATTAPAESGVYALFEVEAPKLGIAESDAFWERLIASLGDGLLDLRRAEASSEMAELWAIRERVPEAILLHHEVHQQDLSVPVARLEEFVADIEGAFRREYPDYAVYLFGHIGDGNLHVFIRKPAGLTSAEFQGFCTAADLVLFAATARLGGSVSAEHGVGVLKKPALPFSRTPGELALFRRLKRAFDPEGLLNPGKIIDL